MLGIEKSRGGGMGGECHSRNVLERPGRVRVNGQYSEQFDVDVGVHQGSVLSPLLFRIILEALSRDFMTGTPGNSTLHLSLKIRGKLIPACVKSAMLYGSET